MITSGSSILIRQHYALIYNFDVRFVEICLVFLKTGWENLKQEIAFVAVAQWSPLCMRAAAGSVLTRVLT